MRRGLTLAGLLAALAVALALRLPGLDERPMHTDESVHAQKFLGLWEGGTYRYDPHEYHGPTLYYATLAINRLTLGGAGRPSEASLRLVPLVFGVGLILLLPLFRDGLGQPGMLIVAGLMAVSTALVFFSRYYIHELLLVFFTALFGAAVWRYLRKPHWAWAALTGVALGLMHATKETFVFNLAALGTAAGLDLMARTNRWEALRQLRLAWNWPHLALGGGVALAVSILLFSSFGQNPRGPLDSLLTYVPWFGRAGGNSPHIHPWWFYLERLFWFHRGQGPLFSELLIALLAGAGTAAAWFDRLPCPVHRGFARFLVAYTGALALIYCAIPYKTPWCALGFLHGLILLAGIGAASLWSWIRPTWARGLGATVLATGLIHLGWQSWRATTTLATDQRNPHVYAHTSANLLRLVERVQAVAAQLPPGSKPPLIQIAAPGGDYWPLPWHLRNFKPGEEAHWLTALPTNDFAPIVIAGVKLGAHVDELTDKRWLSAGLYEHRPRVFFELFVELELWKRYLASRPPPSDDDE